VYFWFIVSFLYYVCIYIRVNKDEYERKGKDKKGEKRARWESIRQIAATVISESQRLRDRQFKQATTYRGLLA